MEAIAAPPPPWDPPPELGDFHILAPLGQGGMGKVYLARDTQLDRLVALKFMTNEGLPSARARFRAEAQALARLDHPNIVGVFRIDESSNGHPFIAYEYVRGDSLDRVLLPVRWQTALAILTMVARALGAAHNAGLLHRDVKPANVMITPSGDVKLLDFGLAIAASAGALSPDQAAAQAIAEGGRSALVSGQRLTAPGFALGTPRYWSPEQWRGGKVTTATDVYGLGLIGYELITGRPPYADLTGADLADALSTREIPPIDPTLAPQALLDVIARCLRSDPSQRFASGAEVARSLEQIESVFLTREHAEACINCDEDRVAASWGRASSMPHKLADLVYAYLFEAEPEVRALLPRDLTAQKAKLMHVLDVTIQGLHHPERIAPMLRELGKRHVGYRVEPRHLQAFGRALRRGLAELDPQWSEQINAAWEHAYGFIYTSMHEGMLAPTTTPPAPIPVRPFPSTPVPFEPPRTAYTQADEGSVAYQVFGKGPPDLVLIPGALTHVEATWTHASPVSLLAGLARFARVAIFDKRGSGLSDPLQEAPSLEAMVADTLAVMGAAGMERAIIVAAGESALPAIRLAATHPERVDALVLFGAEPRLSSAPDYPSGKPPEFWAQLERQLGEHWGEPILAEVMAPSASRDPTFTAWFATYLRLASSPRRAVALLRCMKDADERASLPRITAPTLVLRRRGDLVVSARRARTLVDAIPSAHYAEIDGDDHFIYAGDGAALAREIERFAAALGRTEIATNPDAADAR